MQMTVFSSLQVLAMPAMPAMLAILAIQAIFRQATRWVHAAKRPYFIAN